VHQDQGLGRVTFQVQLAGGEGERVEDVAHLTVDRLKLENVVSPPFTFKNKKNINFLIIKSLTNNKCHFHFTVNYNSFLCFICFITY
jgi:hypothetical protein